MADHNRLGSWGEQVVVDYLVGKGYAIVERNWRLNHLEIDIIVTKGDEIAFVEVKTRRDDEIDPLLSITPQKVRRLASAANVYLRGLRLPLKARFDVAAVIGDQHSYSIRYIPNAFMPPLRTYR